MKFEYPTLIYHESDGWNATVPDLPGCYSCGDTFQEARDGIQEAMELWIEVAIEQGIELPRPSLAADQIRIESVAVEISA